MSMHHNICYQAKEPELEHKIYSTVLHCTCAAGAVGISATGEL